MFLLVLAYPGCPGSKAVKRSSSLLLLLCCYTVGFMIHVTCRLTAKNRDQLRNPMLGNRVWATFTFYHTLSTLLHYLVRCQICMVVNDKLHDNKTAHLRCYDLFNNHFTTNFTVSAPYNNKVKRQCRRQCFHTVGWVVGRASGL